jgi:hypothetical protein
MDDLIARLTAATGPDRALDHAILTALNRASKNGFSTQGLGPLPAYTQSLDAALTLVPEGWRVTHAYWDDERAHFTLGHVDRDKGWRDGDAPTPALALCIASLRALQARKDNHG